MIYPSKKFKLSPVCIALLASTSLHVSAQEVADQNASAKDKAQEEQIEVIEVTGLKGSLRKNINDSIRQKPQLAC